jgi:hypothetical protein
VGSLSRRLRLARMADARVDWAVVLLKVVAAVAILYLLLEESR